MRVALDATCDALMTLQSIDIPPPGMPEKGRAGGHVAKAISHLRDAIDELRDAQVHGQTGLALGFVLGRDERNSNGEREQAQSRPWRTA